MNGPKSTELKIEGMKDFGFEPKLYLTSIVKVYLDYINDEEFLKTIVNDERSFSVEIFKKTEKIIHRYKMLNFNDME